MAHLGACSVCSLLRARKTPLLEAQLLEWLVQVRIGFGAVVAFGIPYGIIGLCLSSSRHDMTCSLMHPASSCVWLILCLTQLLCLICTQVVMAIQYVHAKNILHRDLKTQNIFLTK